MSVINLHKKKKEFVVGVLGSGEEIEEISIDAHFISDAPEDYGMLKLYEETHRKDEVELVFQSTLNNVVYVYIRNNLSARRDLLDIEED